MHQKYLFFPFVLLLGVCTLCAQPGVGLHLDGEDDFIYWPLSSTNLQGNPGQFSVEVWVNSQELVSGMDCPSDNRPILSFGGSDTRVELGVCSDELTFYLENGAQSGLATGLGLILPQQWYHLSLVKQLDTLYVLLDCEIVHTEVLSAALSLDTFFLGGTPDLSMPSIRSWLGYVDELRVWSSARSVSAICDDQFCPLSGQDSLMHAYWTFNEGVPLEDNTQLTQVQDYSGNNHHGQFFLPDPSAGFDPIKRIGWTSNFVFAAAPLLSPDLFGMQIEIRDYPSRDTLLSTLASGAPAHFCLLEDGTIPEPMEGVEIQWEYSNDGGSSWNTLPQATFSGFCFPVLNQTLQIDCANSETGFEDWLIRVQGQVIDPAGGVGCISYSQAYPLRLCCPLGAATVSLQPSDPLCMEDSLQVEVALLSPDSFLMQQGGDYFIEWSIGLPGEGIQPLSMYDGMTSFLYEGIAPEVTQVGTICFIASVLACTGELIEFQSCLTVGPKPICGEIDAFPFDLPLNLSLVDTLPHKIYEICPGDDAVLHVHPGTPFLNTVIQWQYTTDNPLLVDEPVWEDLGETNVQQNTNILFSTGTDTAIFYRIIGEAELACDPCFSNLIEIREKPPVPVPFIAPPGGPFCESNTPVLLKITNPAPGITYTWYFEGLPVGFGEAHFAEFQGCYVVEANNGCEVVTSNTVCFEVCEIRGGISCPLPPNECALVGEPVYLSACGPLFTCDDSGVFTFQWYINGVLQSGANDCLFVHTPTGVTDYAVLITHVDSGCVEGYETRVTPCEITR